MAVVVFESGCGFIGTTNRIKHQKWVPKRRETYVERLKRVKEEVARFKVMVVVVDVVVVVVDVVVVVVAVVGLLFVVALFCVSMFNPTITHTNGHQHP